MLLLQGPVLLFSLVLCCQEYGCFTTQLDHLFSKLLVLLNLLLC
jgi:hypothetical protein